LVGLALVLASLGAAVIYFKRRSRGELPRAVAREKLSVLSSTRIGPRAHAVMIDVAGRKLLLGVTDASVQRLAFIDDEDDVEDAVPRLVPRREIGVRIGELDPKPERSKTVPVATPAAATSSASRSFSDVLKAAFSKKVPAPEVDAAVALAAETRDTIAGRPIEPSVRMVDVEGQAKGLLKRLSEPRA
jgi:flagellar biogenesis protein FliO